MKQVTLMREVITPAIAREYLKKNTANRPVSKSTITLYKQEMIRDRWREHPGDPITIADDGTLIDGQHRLYAIIAANKAIAVYVLRGADREDFLITNIGRARTGGDTLSIMGVPNYTVIAASINIYFSLAQDIRLSTYSTARKEALHITNEDILNEYQSSPDLYQEAAHIANNFYSRYRLLTCAAVGGITAYLVKQKYHDLAQVAAFFREVNDPTPEYPYLLHLRRLLYNSFLSGPRGSKYLTAEKKNILVSKAWNYYLAGEDRCKILYRPTDRAHFD